jgi:paraquat-inducible protein A
LTHADIAGTTARALGLFNCTVCGRLNRRVAPSAINCHRCGATLHARKAGSLSRTTALTLAAALLYVPANLYPVLETQTLNRIESDTILQGVALLWHGGSWLLALLVFFASIVVPLLKLMALTLLVIAVKVGMRGHRLQLARLYRLVEFVGRWSMLDIYVVGILIALVHLRALASIQAGPGAVAFAAVVVLTMLAAQAFDPRLLWDTARQGPAT